MNNILTAISTKLSGSSLSSDVGGRIYEVGGVPNEPELPYVVVMIISDEPDNAFYQDGEDVWIQFSLFSSSSSASEVSTMYGHLKTLFDDCDLSITGSTLVWMRRDNLTTGMEEITVDDATQRIRHWSVDYQIITQESS